MGEDKILEDLQNLLDPDGDYLKTEFATLIGLNPKKTLNPKTRKKTSRKEKKILMKYMNLYAGDLQSKRRYPPHFYDILVTKLGWERERVVKWYNNKRNLSAQNKKNKKNKKKVFFEKKRLVRESKMRKSKMRESKINKKK